MRGLLTWRWLLLSSLVSLGSQMSDAQTLTLPKAGFIVGRAATEQDVQNGDALFVAKIGEAYIGTPVAITIPQYALWSHDGVKTLVVIIQAEDANGMRIFGLRDSTGKDTIATGPEVELVGTAPPKNSN